jgi:hypothetical protein
MENQNGNTSFRSTNISYSHRMKSVLLSALAEILGSKEMSAILPPSISTTSIFDQINGGPSLSSEEGSFYLETFSLLENFEKEYGVNAGCGVAVRVGRTWIKYGLREFSEELGLSELDFQLLPLQKKLRTGIEAFTNLFNNCFENPFSLESDEKYLYWQINNGPLTRGLENLCSYLLIGLIQEILYWISGGKNFEVYEKQSVDNGNLRSIILINPIPVG